MRARFPAAGQDEDGQERHEQERNSPEDSPHERLSKRRRMHTHRNPHHAQRVVVPPLCTLGIRSDTQKAQPKPGEQGNPESYEGSDRQPP